MSGIMIVLVGIALYPFVRPWLRRLVARIVLLWRTRVIRWKTWRDPHSVEPWTEAEKRALADALARLIEESREP